MPIVAGTQLYGVLYVESPEDLRFTYDDEDMLSRWLNSSAGSPSLTCIDPGDTPMPNRRRSPNSCKSQANPFWFAFPGRSQHLPG